MRLVVTKEIFEQSPIFDEIDDISYFPNANHTSVGVVKLESSDGFPSELIAFCRGYFSCLIESRIEPTDLTPDAFQIIAHTLHSPYAPFSPRHMQIMDVFLRFCGDEISSYLESQKALYAFRAQALLIVEAFECHLPIEDEIDDLCAIPEPDVEDLRSILPSEEVKEMFRSMIPSNEAFYLLKSPPLRKLILTEDGPPLFSDSQLTLSRLKKLRRYPEGRALIASGHFDSHFARDPEHWQLLIIPEIASRVMLYPDVLDAFFRHEHAIDASKLAALLEAFSFAPEPAQDLLHTYMRRLLTRFTERYRRARATPERSTSSLSITLRHIQHTPRGQTAINRFLKDLARSTERNGRITLSTLRLLKVLLSVVTPPKEEHHPFYLDLTTLLFYTGDSRPNQLGPILETSFFTELIPSGHFDYYIGDLLGLFILNANTQSTQILCANDAIHERFKASMALKKPLSDAHYYWDGLPDLRASVLPPL